MKTIKVLTLIILVTFLMACTLSVNVPKVRTGTTETLDINEMATTGSDPAELSIEMGAGTLNIKPGASSTVQGTVDYNVIDWLPRVVNTGSKIQISQTNNKSVGIPDGQIVNNWDLQLGSTPLDISISTGANEGIFDFSGLSIVLLSISDGASKTSVTFNEPNPVEMDRLEYHTGASEVTLIGLSNAHIKDLEFNGGAGSYKLDFSGELKEDMNVRISSGMSDMTLIIPSGAHAVITLNGGLSNVNANGTWTINGSTYETGSSGPTIDVTLDMAVGNLNLIQE
jgi:hypothetical protein